MSRLAIVIPLAVQTAFKFRLYPSQKQTVEMLESVDVCRRLWNDALAHRKRRWEEERKSTSYGDQCRILSAEMKSEPSLRNVYSQSAQAVLRQLARAFDSFFAGTGRYPKFKSFKEKGSFVYPQAYNGSVKLDASRKRIFLSKIGSVRIVVHRPTPSTAKLKTCTVKCESDGKWYACLAYDRGNLPDEIRLPASLVSPIGVDLGLKSLVTTSDGEKIAPPKFLIKAEAKLRHL
ncbi:MAG TPA: transposase, partial [Nitrososphaerales archaeon]|nr:transposase [Nitrososphaerales archaeon]